jgi:hypothetical protein
MDLIYIISDEAKFHSDLSVERIGVVFVVKDEKELRRCLCVGSRGGSMLLFLVVCVLNTTADVVVLMIRDDG